ncbi:hypothetical protein [Rossellomorea sp. KS-H15a]|uniref:hypothetical protein n=1 Tax=Rossellomorea sp. KS-H15a TaxID=2963940 RepID=UPI0020C62E25|nr:hypothetical protein [Rossellomorea sp. KS-H15a]UTE77217.1 hypothetical protein M1J35_22360 [Rossellomorea sp. KS-H15a]
MGKVVLAGNPYQEEQFDEDKALREMWVFPLKLAGGKKPIKLSKKLIEAKEKEREKVASNSDKELE